MSAETPDGGHVALVDCPADIAASELAKAARLVHGNADRLRDSERILAHFFCAECLTNATRYAPGAATVIDIEFLESELRIRITDEGPGGAILRPGGGLEGLSDRLQTAGGQLSSLSPIGGPTVVTAYLPLS